jgi:hypothetical protein
LKTDSSRQVLARLIPASAASWRIGVEKAVADLADFDDLTPCPIWSHCFGSGVRSGSGSIGAVTNAGWCIGGVGVAILPCDFDCFLLTDSALRSMSRPANNS